MPTRRYNTLTARVSNLEKNLLPTISPSGKYTPNQYDLARSYLILCHAEVESYLEDITLSVLHSAKKRWTSENRAGRCLTALLMYEEKKMPTPISLDKKKPNETMSGFISNAVKNHERFITRENHGVKETNILRLLLPVGLLESDLDPVWLSSMNSFGVSRGVIAHSSARHVSTPPDPLSAKNSVASVLGGLMLIEPKIVKLRRQ